MADPSDFAYQPPTQGNAYGPANDDVDFRNAPAVEKQVPMASRLIREGEAMERPVAPGIVRK